MRTDRIQGENTAKLNLINGVKKIQRSSEAKDFDYYLKRGLTQEEQRKEQKNTNKNTGCSVRKIKNKNQEKEKVRAFKRTMNAKIGIEAYQKILEQTANMQEQQYQENKAKEQEEK